MVMPIDIESFPSSYHKGGVVICTIELHGGPIAIQPSVEGMDLVCEIPYDKYGRGHVHTE